MNKFKKPLPIFLQAIVVYVGSLTLSLIFSGLVGRLYRYIEGPYKNFNVGVIFSEGFDSFLGGFMWGYFLFLGFLLGFFILKIKPTIAIWLVGIIYFIITAIFIDEWFFLLCSICLSVFGFLLGKLILLVYKKIKK